MTLEEIQGSATARATRARVDSHRPRFRFTSAAIGMFVLVLLADGGDAQTVPIADAHGSVANALLANQPREVTDDSIRPFQGWSLRRVGTALTFGCPDPRSVSDHCAS